MSGQQIPDELTAELTRLELLLLEPKIRRDRGRVDELLAEDFVEFGSSGRVWTREAILELLATETYTPPAVEDLACRKLSHDVALLTYRTVRTHEDGERAAVLRCSVWVNRDGRWKVSFHQGTRMA